MSNGTLTITTLKNGKKELDERVTKSKEECYAEILKYAKLHYSYKYPGFQLRNVISKCVEKVPITSGNQQISEREYLIIANIVVKDEPKSTRQNNNDEGEDDDALSKALNKALQDVREGSRIAIDQIRVTAGMNREEYKDNVVELLLDKGYKVVAKEYLEKLYEEQKGQRSGIYNERTTVKSNNFSAVGYFLNVRLTETSLRVQVVNVSTGEYESNVTIKL